MTAAVKDLVEVRINSLLHAWVRELISNQSATQNVIEGNKIVVFSKSWCPYCRKAKTFLAEEYPNASAKIIEYVWSSNS